MTFLEKLSGTFDPLLFWEYRAVLLPGLAYNFYVYFMSVGVAISLGLIAAVLRLNQNILLRAVGTFYAELCRNTPEYIVLIWIYYVPPLILTQLLQTRISFSPFLAAVIALGLSSSGYFTETFRTGILAVPKGHVESARSLGMSKMLTLRRIVLPQALRHMLPEAMNQLVSLFKGTSLVSLITVPDLLYQVSIVTQQESKSLPLYSGAAFIFFVLVFSFSTLVKRFSNPWREKSRA